MTQPSAGKIMTTIFWDGLGLFLIVYLPYEQTITGKNFFDVLDSLTAAII